MSQNSAFLDWTEQQKLEKLNHIMRQTGADEDTVLALLETSGADGDSIETLLQMENRKGGDSQNSPHTSIANSVFPDPQKVPTFGSHASRPNVLDLSGTNQYQNRPSVINGQSPCQVDTRHIASPQGPVSPYQQSPHSPHTSMHSPHASTFNYNQDHTPPHSPVHRVQESQPLSPHQRPGAISPHQSGALSPHERSGAVSPHHSPYGGGVVSPHSPVSPRPGHHSPVSPHHTGHGGMPPHSLASPHGAPVSPHDMRSVSPHMSHRSGSVSPVPHGSPVPGASSVFYRYSGASPVSMHSGDSEDNYYGGMKRSGNMSDKGSDMYRAKRERNNVAVRKSREKKKQREMEMERRASDLAEENSQLQNKLDTVVKEMNLLKNLYKSIGLTLPPEAREKLESELSKFAK